VSFFEKNKPINLQGKGNDFSPVIIPAINKLISYSKFFQTKFYNQLISRSFQNTRPSKPPPKFQWENARKL
jgi:hypothetical protein